MNMINHDTIHRVHLGHTYTPYFLRIDFEIGMAAVEVWSVDSSGSCKGW